MQSQCLSTLRHPQYRATKRQSSKLENDNRMCRFWVNEAIFGKKGVTVGFFGSWFHGWVTSNRVFRQATNTTDEVQRTSTAQIATNQLLPSVTKIPAQLIAIPVAPNRKRTIEAVSIMCHGRFDQIRLAEQTGQRMAFRLKPKASEPRICSIQRKR